MRLQRIEISGFKSFSDRSELAFDTGVTAIVGPNGCGKSNVADAITWVLGEQSARSLRGERMEDVIFSGSDARRPTQAAEVRLLLTDVLSMPSAVPAPGHGPATDEDAGEFLRSARQVELTRRLFRSGESEYLIDGAQCRLRDIHELLMDTGLGAKAYAIIEQGKIGMILSSRPTDRRQLIEEAAGITKYKARRRSAELKLDAARQNLARIDDIVFEVEKQRGTLQRQAARARRYRRLRDELRRWEKVLFAHRYRDLQSTIGSVRGRLAAAREREASEAARVAERDAAVSRLRLTIAEADLSATAARERVHTRELEIQRRQQDVELNRQQVAVLTGRIAELTAELAALEARREPQRVALAEKRQAADRAQADRDQAATNLAEVDERFTAAGREIQGLEGDVEAARSQVYSALNSATALRHAIDHAALAREKVAITLAGLDVEASDLRLEREELAATHARTAQARDEARAALERAQTSRTELEARLAAARVEQDRLTGAVRTQEQEVAGLAARLASLEEVDASRRGYTEAARELLAHGDQSVGHLGAVADYLEVTDRQFERAVEACLGDLVQHVLVPTCRHAAAGLDWVRRQSVGRCGFVAVDAAAAWPEPAGPAPAPGLRPLLDVLRISGPHASGLRRVVGDCWIADSLENAVAGSARTMGAVVTLDGDVARFGALLAGGQGEARGILSTKGEIKELRRRVQGGREAVSDSAARLAAAGALVTGTLDAIEEAITSAHQLEKTIVGCDAQLARAAEDAERLDRRHELLETERRQAEEEAADLDARQAEARQSIARLEAEQRLADERFNDAQGRLFAARDTIDGLTRRVGEAKAAHAALVERAGSLAAEVARLEDAGRELEATLGARSTERADKTGRVQELERAIADGLAAVDRDAADLVSLQDTVRHTEDAAAMLRADVGTTEEGLRAARAGLDTARGEVTSLEVACATAESDLAHLAQSCQDTTQVSLDDVLAEVDALEREGTAPRTAAGTDEPDDSTEEGEGGAEVAAPAVEAAPPATAEDAIARLREKIDRLGPVNMMAIEQFDELEARHTFLTTQRTDLVDSIAATMQAIDRIDETSTARFHEAFVAINQNFQTTFSTLFGGGRAGITLVDDADPLESGIDIVASPPGKRLQNVQLLSGGEKALTAIALMFAIFTYKPSPFCLLDEIDAPLDDANIGRFVEMLKGMLHHTQFILITHNRKTMEIADRLYGVTMEEPGVSKLVSVRLN